ncbi:hypothetical protein N7532_000393 [Penicillium argentinense]|uniref:BZIP domain-containing protein n=1 Tax=Penicillium argentinense TaxID=1131581 RepID=A0A9W9KNU3_9EURO|nr:uncharacterized protein N7532_000393 [Penicillium argentinense]KAJ5112348.1 hypothetical protein N7532_000393 [Penicillium argentinense]
MPAAEDSRSDPPLSDTLSARSYLELGGLRVSHEADTPTPDSLQETTATLPSVQPVSVEGKSGPRSPTQKPLGSEKTVKAGDPPAGLPRKRGRPRLETTKNAAAVEERRLQIRRAQRTYRQKKEATIQTLKTRVEVLEQTLQNVSDLMGPEPDADTRSSSHALARRADLDFVRTRKLVLAEIDRARSSSGEQSPQNGHSPETLRDIFGYHISDTGKMAEDTEMPDLTLSHRQDHKYPRPRSPSPLINRLFPTTTIFTYSYQESDLSRRLQRFCLEHTYRWLTDPYSSPELMSRVFGLFPCIHDMPGVRRNFRRVLHSEIGGPLEVNKLPFYKLGGAGTHYPRRGVNGQPIYPEQLRRPGKILRRLARILRRGGIQDWDEDWSGDVEPGRGGEGDGEDMSEEDRLRALNLDGEWFDCHDVQGYLEHRGVSLDSSTMWLEVPPSTVGILYGFSPDYSASQYYVSPGELSSSDMSGTQYLGQSSYVLDLESFFDRELRHFVDPQDKLTPSPVLLANLRILGRAPGFRLWDVDAALRVSIRRRPLG